MGWQDHPTDQFFVSMAPGFRERVASTVDGMRRSNDNLATKVAIGEHEYTAGAKHERSEAAFGTHGHSPKARDIEAIVPSNLRSDPMMQLASSRIRRGGNRIVQRWVAIAAWQANTRR
jgi:hypothetical protein